MCASGCTYTNSQLQAALDAAAAGDTVLLQAGHTYTGTFEMRRHGGSLYVTVRTGVTSTGALIATSTFPASGVRMTAGLAASLNLATLRANVNNAAALTTAAPASGLAPAYWHVKWLRFAQNASADMTGSGSLISCGRDSSASVRLQSEVASHFVFEQIYAAGDPVSGQFRGISIHCNNTTLKDSTVEHIKSPAEGQAVWWNSASNLTLVNNYLSGGTETFLSAGSGGCCRNAVTVSSSPAPTTTTATLSSRDGLRVGHGVRFTVGGAYYYTEIASCGTSTPNAFCTSNSVTFTPALPAAPDRPGQALWGPINFNLTARKNVFTRPLSMRDPVLATPTTLTAARGSGGTLAAGTYSYRVVARAKVASNSTSNVAVSAASAEVSATLSSTGSVVVSWAPVAGATEYRVYGRTSGGQKLRWTVNAPAASFTDTGSAGTSETVPTSSATRWLVKNTFELKNTDGAVVEGNIIEHSWTHGQTGYLVLLTPTSASGENPSSRVRNVTFRHNIVRHGNGGIQLTGRSTSSQPTGRTENISLTNNVFYDINGNWGGGSSHWMLITTSPDPMYGSAPIAPAGVTIEHNTIDKVDGSSLIFLDLNKSGDRPIENAVYRNNLAKRVNYGIYGNNSCQEGGGTSTRCWTRYTTGTASWGGNVIAGATCSNYPSGTQCPSTSTLDGYYENLAAGNLKLKATAPYKKAGTDGLDIGVSDWATLDGMTSVALSGNDGEGGGGNTGQGTAPRSPSGLQFMTP